LDTNTIIDTPDAQYYIEETYQNYDHEDLGDEFGDPTYIHPTELAKMHYIQGCNTATRILQTEPDIAEIVVWSRDTYRNEQIVKVWSSSRSYFPDFKNVLQYSKVEFLHVDYRHPKMGDIGIELTIPKQLMIVGNELFSPAFLYRWLKYFSNVSNVSFVFDDTYCVYLMDDNVNQHILRYGDYIVLGETDIEIVRKSVYKEPTTLEIDEETKEERSYNYEEDEEEETQHPEEPDYENVSNQL
jgi:hypothetical protein